MGFLMGSCCDDPALTAIFDATTLSWTGSGKSDIYFEEGITLLPGRW
jgi:hypothetical protein